MDSLWNTSEDIKDGNAAGIAVQGAGAALDGLGAIVHPLGSLAAAGDGWLIEHCEPLRWRWTSWPVTRVRSRR